MSNTPKRPYQTMFSMAQLLVKRLEPACERIEIVGSLRREKDLIGDIELIAIPKAQKDLFGQPATGLPNEVEKLIGEWPVILEKNGPKWKRLVVSAKNHDPFTVDLFLVPADEWGVAKLIRTGSKEFSHKMVTLQSQGGFMPDGFQIGSKTLKVTNRVFSYGTMLNTPSEKDVFTLWGMDYVEPKDRS